MAQYKTFSTMGREENVPNPSSMAEVPQITSAQQRQAIIRSHTLVVIDNYTDWCGPCQQTAPHYAVLAGKYSKPGLCALVKENVEDGCGATPVPIRGVPCFHFYINGQFLQDEMVTGGNIAQVEETIRKLLQI